MQEPKDAFDWGDNDNVVTRTVAGIAVYDNPHGDIVIRQEGIDFQMGEDQWVVIPIDAVDRVIARMREVRDAIVAERGAN